MPSMDFSVRAKIMSDNARRLSQSRNLMSLADGNCKAIEHQLTHLVEHASVLSCAVR